MNFENLIVSTFCNYNMSQVGLVHTLIKKNVAYLE